MKWYVLVTLLALAFAGGWATSTFVQKTVNPQTQQSAKTESSATTTPPSQVEPLDIYSGTGMTPDALYDTLDTLSGIDFDKRYINYVLLLQADITGINRLAKERAVTPAFRERAAELWGLDSQRLLDLYTLQKVQGYSHH